LRDEGFLGENDREREGRPFTFQHWFFQ
jgi:hypothetical protein